MHTFENMATSKPTNPEEKKERFTFWFFPSLIKKLDKIKKIKNSRDESEVELSRTDILNEAVEQYVERFEKKHGEIKL